ncbi:MAG: Dam family site-specific DNA-(adenine-N6)-methyltransferase [Firmicutes bacterium]|nr:Dam family site-specific DNA-(adenine-N6)-methyltransferase [Bacillota bacterium]
MSADNTPKAARTQLRPPLKWAGGKRWLVPILKQYWLKHRGKRLVEPFCGGLAVPLGLEPSDALLNDINPHLINFYKWVQKGLIITLQMEQKEDIYYRYRKRFNELIGPLGRQNSKEAAELFYYLNRTGYNGLCRFNQNGEFNVPFGRHSRINYVKDFTAYQELFARWEFRCGDFQALELAPNDFVYADPPYDVEFTQYSKESFQWEDQVRLAHWLAEHDGPVVLSNQATPRIVELYYDLGFHLRFLRAPRKISCTGDRSPVKEVLAIRNC